MPESAAMTGVWPGFGASERSGVQCVSPANRSLDQWRSLRTGLRAQAIVASARQPLGPPESSRRSTPTRCCTMGTRGKSLPVRRWLQRVQRFALRAPGGHACLCMQASRSCTPWNAVRSSSRRCDRASMPSSSAKRWSSRHRCLRASCVWDICTARIAPICAPIEQPFGSADRIGRVRPRRARSSSPAGCCVGTAGRRQVRRCRQDLLRHRRPRRLVHAVHGCLRAPCRQAEAAASSAVLAAARTMDHS